MYGLRCAQIFISGALLLSACVPRVASHNAHKMHSKNGNTFLNVGTFMTSTSITGDSAGKAGYCRRRLDLKGAAHTTR